MTRPLWGPLREGDTTTFRLWAPAFDSVGLEIEGRDAIAMSATKDGWHRASLVVPSGFHYRFCVGGRAVPDPASRAQERGWSTIVDAQSYRWKTDAWRGRPWCESVLYEVHAGLLGGFAGVEKSLPALAELGITAVELMPVAQFPGRRNWGYDGVLPYAPAESYGTPDDLKRLVDAAHALGVSVFLDVVYNHFGPDGNYLPFYAPAFFRQDRQTPWGAAIDFRRPEVRCFFIDNAIHWVDEFRIDGLRLDAVHAIGDDDFLADLAREVRACAPDRQVHIVVENENNDAALLCRGLDAQWNDDFHHAVHVLLTGEHEGYYADYAEAPAEALARALREGFIYQGEISKNTGRARGTPSAALPPTAFVDFLQNHDHVGNRARGERLIALAEPKALEAAVALLLLAPAIPLLFMGEEVGAREPFLYFCEHADPKLADAVRQGRRNEFARFAAFADSEARAAIPDPNAPETFDRSRPHGAADAEHWRSLYRRLLRLRHARIVPHLDGARALRAQVIGLKAVSASWTLGDGSVLTLASNLGEQPAEFETRKAPALWGAPQGDSIAAATTLCWIVP
ncbi:MAG: malto-oligosyltrehalose trehalohydrolase [Alphaproteobacteria bacterium]|nr:malto-oligosyltrehalose trehalohydrolase [Alphaproteobacteria bacterium]MBV9695293.1 malto-oligosyltrehalose trehalohydrolase [Alphaproteobacteria bacterium]